MAAPQAVFLDRDGVLVEAVPVQLRSVSGMRFLPGAVAAAARLSRAGCRVILATNQRGTAVGWARPETVDAIHARIQEAVAAEGGRIDCVQQCRHGLWRRCPCAKPRPGMLVAAAGEHGLDPRRCVMVGDNVKDVAAGRAFGCATVALATTHGTAGIRRRLRRAGLEADHVAADLPDAVEWILGREDAA